MKKHAKTKILALWHKKFDDDHMESYMRAPIRKFTHISRQYFDHNFTKNCSTEIILVSFCF